jgi:hypothetical protein
MRRTLATTALVLVATLFVGVQPALAAPIVEQIPGHARQDLSPFCVGSQDVVDQRDPRTLTTWTDRRGAVVLQTLATRTTDLFTRGDGTVMDLQETSLVTVRPNPRGGDATILFLGRGALWGTNKANGGAGFLLWVTGLVVMKGSFDPKTGTYALTSMSIIGQQTDLCEAIDEGLKPRH